MTKFLIYTPIFTILGAANAFVLQPFQFGASSRSFAIQLSQTVNVLDGQDIEKELAPINNMILVKKAEVVDQTGGGIFLTGKSKIAKSEGEVISSGPGRINSESGFQRPMPVSVGDSVLFGKFDGEEVTYNGNKHVIIRDDDVLVKFGVGKELTIENAEVVWDNVLVKIEIIDVEATGGLLIAATAKKASTSSVGEVIAVGPGKYALYGVLIEMDVAPGDMVKFRDFAAQEVDIGGVEYAVLKMTDLIAKF